MSFNSNLNNNLNNKYVLTPIFPEILFELQIKMTIISCFKDSITSVKKKQKKSARLERAT